MPESAEASRMADIEIPVSGIVNPPVVIQALDSAEGYAALKAAKPAIAVMKIDRELNILSGEGAFATADNFFADYGADIIPAFFLDSEATAEAVTDYLLARQVIDALLVADDAEDSPVSRAERAAGTKTGVSKRQRRVGQRGLGGGRAFV